MSIEGALCPNCIGASKPISSGPPWRPVPLTRDCKVCMGTEMDPIPWAELFKDGRDEGLWSRK